MPHEEPKPIEIELHEGGTLALEIIEPVYADRTCGQYENGWLTIAEGIEYFVSECGIVYGDDPEKPHDNLSKAIGTAPDVKAQADRYEAQIAEALEHCS
jgi:hypothetical protein